MRPVPAPEATGTGPDVVVLLHGVGVGAAAFAPVAAILATTATVVVPDRRGYGSRAHVGPASSLDELVDDLAAVVEELAERHGRAPTVVGVSGGATLALALALRAAAAGTLAALGPVIVHEPLLGPLAPRLHEAVTTSFRLTVAADPALAATYVAGLIGPATWAGLPPAERAAIPGRSATIAAEIPHFLGFAPTHAELAALRGHPLLASIGGWSPPTRREAHDLLVAVAGATAAEIPDAGHLPQVDAPEGFAVALRRTLAARPAGVAP